MQIAIVGLGRMGSNIALHLLEQGVDVVAYNRSREKSEQLKELSNQLIVKSTNNQIKKGAIFIADTLGDIPRLYTASPIIVFLYVPAGVVTEEILFGARAASTPHEFDQIREKVQPGLVDVLPKGSIIVDGGNSFYQDSQRRYQLLREKGLHFLDMGTSGGLTGARNGACLMVGGDEEVYKEVEPILAKMATKDGFGYFGFSGTGHYVKMIHNAVEYGMMGAIGEGMNLISNFKFQISNENNPIRPLAFSERGGEEEFEIDLAKVAKVWAHGSIVSGHLMNMAESAFSKDPKLDTIAGEVPRGETEVEMEWLQTTGIEHPVIEASVNQRKQTRATPSFIGKVIAALRREFGGHAIKKST